MPLEGMRDLLKKSLGRSLETLQKEDRLSVAWSVACGKAMAGHGAVVGFADGVMTVEVAGEAWMRQMMSMRGQLIGEISRVAGVKVNAIDFIRKRDDG